MQAKCQFLVLLVATAVAIGMADREASAVSGWIFSEDIGFGAGSGVGHFNSPSGLAIGDLDRDGRPDLIIADTGNNRIQRANFNTPTGDPDFDVLAITGLSTPKGMDVDTQRGLIFVADTGNNRVLRVPVLPPGLGVGPPEAIATGPGSGLGEVNAARGVSVSGFEPTTETIFVADTGNNRIQRGTRGAGSLTFSWEQLSGPIAALGDFNEPSGIWRDRDRDGERDEEGRLYIADTGNNRVLVANDVTGDPDFDLLMDSGTGLGQVSGPSSIATLLPPPGHNPLNHPAFIFVADTGNNRIQMGIDDGNNINWQFLGGGALSMLAPGGLAVGDLTGDGRPDLVVADTGNNRLLMFVGVPEPSTLLLAGLAAVAICALRRNR